MKKLKKEVIIIIAVFLGLILLVNTKVSAIKDSVDLFQNVEYSEDFKNWLELSDEEKKNVMQPRMYDVLDTSIGSKNPLYKAALLRAGFDTRYSLKDIIPDNLIIRNQQQTNSCWAFAALSSLETNLAMFNYRNSINKFTVYDFSERHMEYATSKMFANEEENEIGYNRNVGAGGNWIIAESYLTNGSGAINESEMPFENNENIIDISEIQNKTISSQIYDTIDFPDYHTQTEEQAVETMNQIKQHIQNYGSVYASIHGNSSDVSAFNCYNNDTGAKYCNNSILHGIDHAVSIIGWDDNYSIDNFAEGVKPTSNGAWIVRNSWGERQEYDLLELKEEIFNTYKNECILQGWNEPSAIPNEFIEASGYTIEGDIAYIKIGDNGIIYVSYEDCNISKTLYGIIKAKDEVDYNNIYQYDKYYPANMIVYYNSNIILCNVFNKKTNETEYLTQVALYAPETYTCKVYVNPNGTSKSKADMQLIELKSGETETIDAGYHTLEFAEPIQINADSFAVAIEIQGTRTSRIYVQLESKIDDLDMFDCVTVENEKCFLGSENDFDNCNWYDLGKLSQTDSQILDGDSTIKAFTVSNIEDDSLKNIEILEKPIKTSYFVGENFDSTGMVVQANYNNNTSVILDNSSYSITNGTNLQEGQASVTISYKDKSVEQPISVVKNNVVKLEITTPPNKTEYKEGEHFDSTGMVVEATYADGTTKVITDYTINDGNNLNLNQTKVTIAYGDITVQQSIIVRANELIEIKVTKEPNKTAYVVGQNFDKTGMVVTGIYEDKSTQEILDYIVEDGNNLTKDKNYVTIKYKDKTTTQSISVEDKTIVGISINKKPSKLKYIQNKEELDLTGGIITVTYNDETTENIEMNSEDVKVTGFSNSKLGKVTIVVSYQSKISQFEVEIIKDEIAKNSNIDNLQCIIKEIEMYFDSSNSEGAYQLIDIEISGITRNSENDSIEYYYALSSDANDENINNWVKINEMQNLNDKLKFKIDTRDVPNFYELSLEDTLYLYVKEVAIKGGNQSIATSKSMKLELNEDTDEKINVDNEEINNSQGNNSEDNTIAQGVLPNAGKKSIIIISLVLIVIILGIVSYKKYNRLKEIK